MFNMNDIAIFGVGGFGREVLTLIHDVNKIEPKWNVIGFFDDGYPIGYDVHGLKVLGGVAELNEWDKPMAVAIAIGTPAIKKKILSKINNPLIEFPTLIHPTVFIGDCVSIENGCIICANCVITCDIKIGDFVILNLACTVGHDTAIGKYSAFMPTCNISGEVMIGESVYCGTGVKIINQTGIGDNAIIGAGAVVTKPIPANCTAVGVPAKVVKISEAAVVGGGKTLVISGLMLHNSYGYAA